MADESSKPIEGVMPKNSKLFEHLNFLIVVTKPEQLQPAKGTADLLRAHSCQICTIVKTYVVEEAIPLEDVKSWFADKVTEGNLIHFIISEDCTFPFYHVAAFDFLIPVVTSGWIHGCIAAKRHVRTSSFSSDSRHIFKDFQIYVSRHSFNSSEYLFYTEAVHALGGTCADFLSSRTTHLVTNDCQDPGILAVLNFGKVEPIKFIYPTWVVQSFKQLSVASETLHQIDPHQAAESAKNRLYELWEVVNDTCFEASSKILENHSFIIGMDVALSRDLYSTLIDFLQSNGGTVHRHLDETDIVKTKADCYIGKSVSSKEYEVAVEVGLHLGNVIWIFYMWSFADFVLPTAKLIFSPFERKLLERNQLILTYTNFFGQQRFYIQRLVNSIGGFTTSDLSRRNTHLLCRFPFGKKYETAKRWKDTCIVANHLWLEECYKRSTRLDPLEPRFQELPVEGGLRKSLGQMQWRDLPGTQLKKTQMKNTSRQKDNHEFELENTLLPSQPEASPKLVTADAAKHAKGGHSHDVLNQNESATAGEVKEPTDNVPAFNSPLICEEIEMAKESTREEVAEGKSRSDSDCLEEENSRPIKEHFLPHEDDVEIVQKFHATNNLTQRENPSDARKQAEERSQSSSSGLHSDYEIAVQKNAKPLEEESIHGHISMDDNKIIKFDDDHDMACTLLKENHQKIASPSKENSQRQMEDSAKLNFLKAEARTPLSSQPKQEAQLGSKRKEQRKRDDQQDEDPVNQNEQPQAVNMLPADNGVDKQQTKTKLEVYDPNSSAGLLERELNHDYDQSATPAKQKLSQQHQYVEAKSTSKTPTSALTPTSPEAAYSSQSTRRAAKAKAARKLHEDIESLNEFQRYAKRKKTGNLLPDEIAQLEKRRELEIAAKQILAKVLSAEHEIVQNDDETDNTQKHSQRSHRKRLPYHINAVYTGSQSAINELDLVILRLIGITVHNDITNDNFPKLNTIIAPRKLRTAKFLKSFSFHPLRNALTPNLLKDVLKIIHKKERADLQLDLFKYLIPNIDQEKLYKLTSLPTKVFERAGISKINIANDIPGGVEVISSILKMHGVKETKAIATTQMNKLSLQELLANDGVAEAQKEKPIEYLFLATKASQVKFLKKLTKVHDKSILAVEWDWVVVSIFQLQVDFTNSKHVIYQT